MESTHCFNIRHTDRRWVGLSWVEQDLAIVRDQKEHDGNGTVRRIG